MEKRKWEMTEGEEEEKDEECYLHRYSGTVGGGEPWCEKPNKRRLAAQD